MNVSNASIDAHTIYYYYYYILVNRWNLSRNKSVKTTIVNRKHCHCIHIRFAILWLLLLYTNFVFNFTKSENRIDSSNHRSDCCRQSGADLNSTSVRLRAKCQMKRVLRISFQCDHWWWSNAYKLSLLVAVCDGEMLTSYIFLSFISPVSFWFLSTYWFQFIELSIRTNRVLYGNRQHSAMFSYLFI